MWLVFCDWGVWDGLSPTCPVRGMLPHLADQLRHGIPILVTAGIVKLLDVMGGLGCVGLDCPPGQRQRDPSRRERDTAPDYLPSCLVCKPTRTTMTQTNKACGRRSGVSCEMFGVRCHGWVAGSES